MAISKGAVLTISANDASGGALASNSFDSTGGGALIIAFAHEGASTTYTFSDNKGNASGSWAQFTSNATNGDMSIVVGVFYGPAVGTGHVVTVTPAANRTFRRVWGVVVNGSFSSSSALEDSKSAAGQVVSGGDTVASGALTVAGAAFLANCAANYSGRTGTAASGWTEDTDPGGRYLQTQITSTGGTYDPAFTLSGSAYWASISVALKEVASTSPTDGSSAGQGTATATAQASVTTDGSSAGQGVGTGEGAATVAVDGSSAGQGTATAESNATATADGSSAGQGTATAEGTASVSAEMNGAGAATATAEGTSGASVEGAGYSRGNSPFAVLEWTAEGTATGYNVGYSQTSGSGNYTVVDVGNVTTYTLGPLAGGTWYYAVQSYDGGGTGSWSTEATFYISTIAVAAGQATVTTAGSSAGQGTATGVGQATVSAEMNGAGQATATAESQSSDSMAGYSAGTSDGQAVGATIVSAEMNGAGSAIATAESNAGQLVEAAGSSDGTASATAEGASTITAAGSSSGVAIGTAVGTTAEARATTRHEGRRTRRKNDDAEMQWLVEKLTAYIVNGSYGDIVYSEK